MAETMAQLTLGLSDRGIAACTLPKWLNGGIRITGFLHGGSNVFLVGVVEFAVGGFVWVEQHEADLITSAINVEMHEVWGLVLYV